MHLSALFSTWDAPNLCPYCTWQGMPKDLNEHIDRWCRGKYSHQHGMSGKEAMGKANDWQEGRAKKLSIEVTDDRGEVSMCYWTTFGGVGDIKQLRGARAVLDKLIEIEEGQIIGNR